MGGFSGLILVGGDDQEVIKELVSEARRIADQHCWGVAFVSLDINLGINTEALGDFGVDFVFYPESKEFINSDFYVALLTKIATQYKPNIVLFNASLLGLEIAPRMAERTGAGYGPWCVNIDFDPQDGKVVAQCMIYGGQGVATYKFHTDTNIFTVGKGVFPASKLSTGRKVTEIEIKPTLTNSTVQILDSIPKQDTTSSLEQASIVIDIGKGIKQKEDLSLVESLASLLGAQIACSRPLATEKNWFTEWLGLSGKKVAPELCIAVGISGSIQHMVGIRKSRVIVAINNDENAQIFSEADYGVVADLYDFLPIFYEHLKAREVHPFR
jgi:electron transfer flavoprotein alpha subunit